MATLLVEFPGGRYHATPQGHHVNEGLVEWPPSPWRLLRALIACGYATQRWNRGVPPVARELISTLAETLPTYRLPAASLAHSRHYMPTGVLEKGREKTTLVFDTWANVSGTLAVRWPCALKDEALALFATLASHLGYLGRSESWIIAEGHSDEVALPDGTEAFPHVGDRPVGPDWEQVSLLAPDTPGAYAAWREGAVARALSELGESRSGKVTQAKQKARARALAPYPEDLIDCLERDTSWWKSHRWSQPPGSRRVLYWRRTDALSVAPPVVASRRAPQSVTTMLVALTPAKGPLSALPTRARALPQAELLHRALVARARGGCPELTGKDSAGRPLVGHQHAHILPLDLDDDGHLDHVLIHAPMGLGPSAQDAIRGVQRTWTKGGIGALNVALAGQGSLIDLRRLSAPLDGGVSRVLGSARGATRWVTFTPLVFPRHLKPRGSNDIEGQIAAELQSRGLPSAKVEALPWDDSTRHLRHAVRVRRHPARPPPRDAGYALRLTFNAPIQGPLALGYASHFGLGLFVAEEDSA